MMESTHSCSCSCRESSKLVTYTAPSSNRAGPLNCVFFVDLNIRGIAGVGDKLYMVYDNLSNIGVYDSENLGAASTNIHVPNMKSPWGLAGCAYNRALYISDWKPECIRKVDLTNNSITRWKLSENHESRGLFVTAEHTLLVTVEISDTKGQSRVVEYTSEGQLVREIGLDESIQFARQTLQLSSDQLVVCHGGDSSLHRVCVINTEGLIIKSYGGEKGEEIQLSEPYSMTIDDNSQRVFIADRGNNRVLMLETDLANNNMYIDQIHIPPRFILPSCLYFDSSSHRLLVDSVEAPMGRSTLSHSVTQTMNQSSFMTLLDEELDEMLKELMEKSEVGVCDSHSPRALCDINLPGIPFRKGGFPRRPSVTAEPTLPVTTVLHMKTGCKNRVVEYTSEDSVVTPLSKSTLSTIQTLNHDEWVVGVTVVDDEIFVVGPTSSLVRVYDSHSLRKSRDISVYSRSALLGLVGCSHHKALYIGDYVNGFIYRVEVSNDDVTRWKIKENQKLRGLSVTAEHTLLITTVFHMDTGRENSLVEYTTEGKLVREIRLDKSFDKSFLRMGQIIQLSSDQFVISQSLSSFRSRVCVINTDGQIIKFYDRESEESEDQTYQATLIAINYDNKHVYVADSGYCNRVLKLDTECTYLGQIHIHDMELRCLYFDSSTDRLFVGGKSGRLLVISNPD